MYSVFIGSSSEGAHVAQALREMFDGNKLFRATHWQDPGTFRANRSFFESLTTHADEVEFGIFVATGDDLLLRRGKKERTPRDNVLFEFALFCGALGRDKVALVVQDGIQLPSDLKGIAHHCFPANVPSLPPEDCKTALQACFENCIDQFLCVEGRSHPQLILQELHRYRHDIEHAQLLEFLGKSIHARFQRNPVPCHPNDHFARLLKSCVVPGKRKVGSTAAASVVNDYVDLDLLEPGHRHEVASSYARFVASKMNDVDSHATRIAVEYKKDLQFLMKVSEILRIPPALIDINSSRSEFIKGTALDRELTVYVHDFIHSSFTPRRGISLLRNSNARVRKLLAFHIREEKLDEVTASCKTDDIEFEVMCTRLRSGKLRINASI